MSDLQLINQIDDHIYNIRNYTFVEMYKILVNITFGEYIRFWYKVNIEEWLKKKIQSEIEIRIKKG